MASENLVAWYPLNYTAEDKVGARDCSTMNLPIEQAWFQLQGNMNDSSWTPKTTTETNLNYDAGKFGYAAEWDGVSSLATYSGLNLGSTDPCSVSVWFRLGSKNGWADRTSQPLIDLPWIYAYVRETNNTPRWRFDCSGTSRQTREITGSALGSDYTNWHHFLGTFNGGSYITLYIDGVLQGTAAMISGPWFSQSGSNAGTFNIGKHAGAGSVFAGFMEDIRIYRNALSSTEVSYLYNQGSGTFAKLDLYTSGTVGKPQDCVMFPGSITSPRHLKSYSRDFYNFGSSVFSIAGWIYPDSGAALRTIVSKYSASSHLSWNLYVGSDNMLNFYTTPSGDGTGALKSVYSGINIGSWNHFVVNKSGTGTTCYVNGSAITGIGSANSYIYKSLATMQIGAVETDGTWRAPFSGKISDLRFYNKQLSSTDVANLYNYGSGLLLEELGYQYV